MVRNAKRKAVARISIQARAARLRGRISRHKRKRHKKRRDEKTDSYFFDYSSHMIIGNNVRMISKDIGTLDENAATLTFRPSSSCLHIIAKLVINVKL